MSNLQELSPTDTGRPAVFTRACPVVLRRLAYLAATNTLSLLRRPRRG